jgi:pimeloyl-ACP methyl ester carboxylesterase
MLTSPNRLLDIFEEFQRIIGLGNAAFEELIHRASSILNEPLEQSSVTNKLATINYRNLVLIHDINDKVLPYSNSQEIHSGAPSSLQVIENAGHYRMLWNPLVIDKINTSLGTSTDHSVAAEVRLYELMTA